MTEAVQEGTPKRRRKPKNTSMPVMKQLLDLLETRTALMNQLRTARMTVGQLESQLLSLAQEVEWRSSVLGLSETAKVSPPAPVHAFPQPGAFDPSMLTQPIFHAPPPPPASRDGINRGMADLRGLS